MNSHENLIKRFDVTKSFLEGTNVGAGIKRSGEGLIQSGGGLLRSGGVVAPMRLEPIRYVMGKPKQKVPKWARPLYSQGGGPVLAKLGEVAAPAITNLIEKGITKGIPWLGKQAWKGIKKVGRWFKRLFGRGILIRDANGQMRMGDIPMHGIANLDRKSLRDLKRVTKLNDQLGGISADRLKKLLKSAAFRATIGKTYKKPHLFLNKIGEGLKNNLDMQEQIAEAVN